MGEIERNEFDLGGFVVFGFMGLGFSVGWWVCERGLVVESGGAIGLLVGLISMVASGFECWGHQWVVCVLVRLCQRDGVRGIFVLLKMVVMCANHCYPRVNFF